MFNPSVAQSVAKRRLHEYVQTGQGIFTLTNMPLEVMVKICQASRLPTWLKDPEFAAWLIDAQAVEHRVQALKDVVVFTLQDILTDLESNPRDRLKAADMLLQLAGAYPGKSGPQFLDAALTKMTDHEAARELEALKLQLTAGSVGKKT